jgi:hypothetical protein
MRKLLIKLLLKLLDQELPMRTSLTDDTRRTMLSRVYQNPAMLNYLEDREQALVKQCFEAFLAHRIEDARGVAGQVYELRTLHSHLRVCYNSKREDRNRITNPRRTLRGHAQVNQSED